ncbi:hypothetical protein HGRIS_001821 [Hohenbuehelia grisea]|uniref:Translin n=1 Tax=Hohenbuehelia grisea TaxID=104357 RepID=A0ABR3JIZ4_9AGAR
MDPSDLDHINSILDGEGDLREKIRERVHDLDKHTRTMVGALNKIHSTPPNQVKTLVASVSSTLALCQQTNAQIAGLVPRDQFWRWKDMWTNSLRTAIFCVTLIQFLSDGTLLPLNIVTEKLGIKGEWSGRFELTVEDYLHGLITLVNELSRLAVNSVTLGNFEQPIKISIFVKDIFNGFTMLNLKNDTLRRRYDSLKYDIKKIEEVVYDVSLRKLAPPPST